MRIEVGLAQEQTPTQIARALGRDRSTVYREIARNKDRRPAPLPRPHGAPARGPVPGTNRGRDRGPEQRVVYRAELAQIKTDQRAMRPKPGKLAGNPELRERVTTDLRARWSPQQISARLIEDYPDQPEMRVSHETVYKALFVQGRGELRRELTQCLRTGRALRKPHRIPGERRGTRHIPAELMISARPAEVADRAIPGHWEGDLIIGKDGASAIGTLVERATRYVMLLHLPADHSAETVRDAMLATIPTLPTHLWRSLTWDQGNEMARHIDITLATGLDIYFCDPHSPWQRGSNENTNGLLRADYFPKGSDLSQHSAEHLATVAAQLNGRPRKTLNWRTPAETLHKLLSTPQQPGGVALTP